MVFVFNTFDGSGCAGVAGIAGDDAGFGAADEEAPEAGGVAVVELAGAA